MDIEEQKKILANDVAMRKSTGYKTRELLKDLEAQGKICKSPNTSDKIKIAPGLWIKPKKLLKTQKEIDNFIEEKRKKYIKFYAG